MAISVIKTAAAPEPIGPYNQAIEAGGFIFISGQIAIVPGTGVLHLSSIEEETRQVLKNLEAILKEAGSGFSQVVKTTIFLSDMAHFTTVNNLYAQYFEKDFPARETVAVKTLPKSVNVEISMIAYKG
jgi:2-iminobutanoate/2-iminopropanoate deaminase